MSLVLPHADLTLDKLQAHDAVEWGCDFDVAKWAGEAAFANGERPFDIVHHHGNLLMTVGATDIWNALSAGLSNLWSTANTQIAIGDGVTAAAIGNTDLAAAAAAKINAADVTSATNATPIVVGGTFSPVPTVGSVLVNSGFSGAGAAAINQTFEVSASSGSSITLLNSVGSGAITLTGGVLQPINKYRQYATGTGSAVVSTNTLVYVAVFGANNANFTWAEFMTAQTLAATVNKQAAPPLKVLNRAVAANGIKASGAVWTATETLSIS